MVGVGMAGKSARRLWGKSEAAKVLVPQNREGTEKKKKAQKGPSVHRRIKLEHHR